MLFSIPFVVVFNVLRQFTDGTTDTMTGMYPLLIGNILNIVGNWLLIYGIGPFPEMGLLGAGIATLFSRVFMAFFFCGGYWFSETLPSLSKRFTQHLL